MTTQTVQTTPTQAVVKIHKIHIGNFGNGRYSPAMEEIYKDTQRLFGFTPIQSHVTAAQVGRDAGQLANQRVTLAYGKASGKDSKMGLKEVTKAVKVNSTWALAIAYIASELDSLRKQGLICGEDEGSQYATINPRLQTAVDDACEGIEAMTEQEIVSARK